MRIRVFALDFVGQGALLEPVNRKLHDLAVDYCRREIAGDVNLIDLRKVWVAATVEDNQPLEVVGITGYVLKPDIPVFRVSGDEAARATKLLIDRVNGFFADNGATGSEVFIHISGKETPEQRCSKWQDSLTAVGAQPADRFSIIVK